MQVKIQRPGLQQRLPVEHGAGGQALEVVLLIGGVLVNDKEVLQAGRRRGHLMWAAHGESPGHLRCICARATEMTQQYTSTCVVHRARATPAEPNGLLQRHL